uniref:Amiloride-sensitive sodium channel n=1 Tax=Macrostomum lignano TaxID=282301 RepID=A0A1I8I0C2_9PLAT
MAEAQLQQICSMDLLLWNPEIDLSTESQSTSRAAAIEGFLNGDSIMMALHPTEVHGLSAIKTSAIHLQHGKMSELHFDVTVSNFMNCARQKLQHGNSGEFSYTSGHCRFLDFDAKTRRECNCTYDPMAFPMPRCGQLHKGQSVLTEFNRRISCAAKTSTESSVCSLPSCSQTEYAVSPLFYDWGINDFQWKWFWEFAMDWEKGLVEYWQYRGLNASQRTQALRQPLVNFSEVSRHLSSVRIVRRSLQTTFETEVALTSAANLLSSLGGALSMYMGVTVTLVAEFAEFLVLVFRALRSRRRAVIEVQEVSAKQ